MGKIKSAGEMGVALYRILKKSASIASREGLGGIKARAIKLSRNSLNDNVNEGFLSATMNNVFDLPDVVINKNRAETINVLVPAFDFGSMSAGFFGVFQAALFFKHLGYNVRLVLFDNFYFNYKAAKQNLKNYPGLETLFDELEVEYIGDKNVPLQCSPNDTSLATVWYSAYLADKISKLSNKKKFYYLIQDYETNFYPGSTDSLLAEESYKMNYNAMFSTETLKDYFVKHDIGGIKTRNLDYIVYNNCCSCSLPSKDAFLKKNSDKKKKKLVFYSRPIVNRNMFELGAYLIIKAVSNGILNPEEWEFYGVGLGEANLQIADNIYLKQLPRMNLKDYIDSISGYDLGISLMASPHPSLVPFDLAGSGCVVLTNSCYTKDQKYFNTISKNIICKEPNLDKLLNGIKEALKKIDNYSERYENALNMNFPTSWDQTWTKEHENWVKKVY